MSKWHRTIYARGIGIEIDKMSQTWKERKKRETKEKLKNGKNKKDITFKESSCNACGSFILTILLFGKFLPISLRMTKRHANILMISNHCQLLYVTFKKDKITYTVVT